MLTLILHVAIISNKKGGENMTIGDRIKKRREELNISQEELGLKLGYKSRSSINKIELDGRSLPQSKIKAIAEALETTPSYIMGWEEERLKHWDDITDLPALRSEILRLQRGMQIPVLGEVAAGTPIFAEENYIGYEEISEEIASTGKYFGLKIKGDSMSPRISEGDTVIVRQQDDAESGDIVIVLVNGDSATCKKLMKYQDGISLISLNPTHEPMVFTNKEIIETPINIIGKVVENRQKY